MLIQHSQEGIFLLDEKGIILESNPAINRLYQTDTRNFVGQPVWQFDQNFLPREQRNKKQLRGFVQTIQNFLRQEPQTTLHDIWEQEIAGEPRFIQLQIIPVQTTQGYFYVRIHSDVSEAKATENELTRYKAYLEDIIQQRTQELERSNASLRLVLQTVPIVFYSYQLPNRQHLWYSEQIESFSGYSKEMLIAEPDLWKSRVHPDDLTAMGEAFDNLNHPQRIAHEYRWKDANNRELWIYDQAVKIPAGLDQPEQVVGCFIDISERKEAEMSIRESEWNYREVFNSASDAIFIHHFDTGAIEDVNETMLTMFITDYEKVLEGGIEGISSGEPGFDLASAREKFEEARLRGSKKFEWHCQRGDGMLFWADVVLKKVTLKGESKLLAVVRDIDEKKQSEKLIRYQTEFEKLILDISSRFINVGYADIDSLIKTAIESICHFSKSSAGYLMHFQPETETLLLSRYWHEKESLIPAERMSEILVKVSGLQLTQLQNNQVHRFSRTLSRNEHPEELASLLNETGIGSIINVPLFYQNNFVGLIGLGSHDSERSWLNDEISLLQIIGQMFVNALKRKESFNNLRNSEQSYREIYNATADAIIIMDRDTSRFLDVNDAMLHMFDLAYEEALNVSFDALSAGQKTITNQTAQKLINKLPSQGTQSAIWQGKKKNGTLFWVEMTLKLANLLGQERILITLRDISERIASAEMVKQNEEKYRMLVENQTELIVKIDPNGTLSYVSQSYCDVFGKREDELLGTSFYEPIHKTDKEKTIQAFHELSKAPHTCTFEHRAFSMNGWRWHAWNNKALLDSNHQIREILCVGRDITYQKGVEEALRRSEDRFRSIVQQLSDVVLICDRETHIIYDTPSVQKLFGYQEGYLVGQSLIGHLYTEDKKLVEAKITELLQQKDNMVTMEFRVVSHTGRIIPVEGVIIDLLNHSSIHGLIVTMRDISERKLIDKKILDAVIKTEEQERERFAKNLHDDLGPLLSSIKMYMGTLNTTNTKEKQDFIIAQLQEIVKEAITTTKEVSNDLSPHILMNYGLVSAIENFCKKVPAEIKVHFKSSQLAQRYSNAVENSFYRIIKELINNTLKHANAHEITIHLEETGQNLVLEYADDGKGADIQKIIKADNPGMGISNIISRAKSLNGKYDFSSYAFGGFSFKLVIPLHQVLT